MSCSHKAKSFKQDGVGDLRMNKQKSSDLKYKINTNQTNGKAGQVHFQHKNKYRDNHDNHDLYFDVKNQKKLTKESVIYIPDIKPQPIKAVTKIYEEQDYFLRHFKKNKRLMKSMQREMDEMKQKMAYFEGEINYLRAQNKELKRDMAINMSQINQDDLLKMKQSEMISQRSIDREAGKFMYPQSNVHAEKVLMQTFQKKDQIRNKMSKSMKQDEYQSKNVLIQDEMPNMTSSVGQVKKRQKINSHDNFSKFFNYSKVSSEEKLLNQQKYNNQKNLDPCELNNQLQYLTECFENLVIKEMETQNNAEKRLIKAQILEVSEKISELSKIFYKN